MEVEGMTLQKFGKLQENWSIKDKLPPLVMEEVATQVLMNMKEGVILFNDKGKILLYNSTANHFLNIDTSDHIIETINDILPVEEQAGFNRKVLSLLKLKQISDTLVFQTPNNTSLRCQCDLISMERDAVILLIMREISPVPSRHAHSPLIFQEVFQKALHGLVLTNTQGKILNVNQKAIKYLSLETESQIDDFNYSIFKEKEVSLSIEEDFHKKLSPLLDMDGIQTTISQFNDRCYEVITLPNIIQDINLTVLQDVTEMVEMMEQMNKHDTLKIVGQLAAGIAHEIRNPMTALKGFIQLLESSVKEDHSMYFGVIMSELQRIETIMTEFLMLAKPKTSEHQNIRIPFILKETADLMRAQATLYDIELIVQCVDKGEVLFGDANRIKQVFINLVKNAIEAISDGGKIVLSYQSDEYGQRVLIKDSGCGIANDHLKKLNEPFYTTKENGTGLGLVVSFKIIEEHGGKVEVDSEIGKGTVFKLIFPNGKED